MSRVRHIWALLLLLGVVVADRLVHYLYTWHLYREERAHLEVLREQVVDVGVDVLRLQARADTVRREVERDDKVLEEKRRALERFGRYADNGGLPPSLYEAYRRELEEFNTRVRRRNHRAREWEELNTRYREAMHRYQRLTDSIQQIAHQIGDPYYRIPLPVEAAAERGVIPTPP